MCTQHTATPHLLCVGELRLQFLPSQLALVQLALHALNPLSEGGHAPPRLACRRPTFIHLVLMGAESSTSSSLSSILIPATPPPPPPLCLTHLEKHFGLFSITQCLLQRGQSTLRAAVRGHCLLEALFKGRRLLFE